MINAEIERRFISAGWTISDDSTRHLLIGRYENLWIVAYDALSTTDEPTFGLIDGQRTWGCWVRTIPSPRIAAVLLEEHGERLAG